MEERKLKGVRGKVLIWERVGMGVDFRGGWEVWNNSGMGSDLRGG